jgi:hypothetical protein
VSFSVQAYRSAIRVQACLIAAVEAYLDSAEQLRLAGNTAAAITAGNAVRGLDDKVFEQRRAQAFATNSCGIGFPVRSWIANRSSTSGVESQCSNSCDGNST